MFFVLLSGLAHVTLPTTDPDSESSEGLWIEGGGGVKSIIIATDTRGEGHYTAYPGEKTSVALQIPFEDGVVPEHVVVGEGACMY